MDADAGPYLAFLDGFIGVTLIFSAAMGDHIVQVSDRRLTRPNGSISNDEANKAIFFCGRMAFAYTGLSEVGSESTDTWITQTLVNAQTMSLSDACESLVHTATQRFKNLTLPRETKRLAIVGVGWTCLKNESFLSPIICLVSNSHTQDGNWLPEAEDEFTLRYTIGPQQLAFNLISTGQTVPKATLSALRRSIRRCFEHHAGPEPLARLLVHSIRDLAKHNARVGNSLMIINIPKHTVARAAPARSTLLTDLGSSSLILSDTASFSYLGSSSDDVTRFGPNTVCGGTGLRDFKVQRLNQSGSDAWIEGKIVLPTNR